MPTTFTAASPPILIGGEGEKKTLRLVAQYGDACNLYAGGSAGEYAEGIESIRTKLAVLQKHCDSMGHPYDEIERTALAGMYLSQDPTAISDTIQLCQSLAELGVQHVIFNLPNYDLKLLETFTKEIIPKLEKFG